jgi:predicted nicotinamide N-methyase
LWQGSVALACEILENPELVKGKRVIDLGTGLGLAGIAAAMAGAKEVVLTDREPKALYCALCAAAANGLEVVPFKPGSLSQPGSDDGILLPDLLTFPDRRITCASPDSSTASSSKISVSVLDWFAPDFNQFGEDGFDVVLACDVLYTPQAVDVIAPLVLRLFQGEGDDDDTNGEGIRDDDTKGTPVRREDEKKKSKREDKRFVLADPPGRFPANHARFLNLMADPNLCNGHSERVGSGETTARVVRVDSGTTRDCVNLKGEVMTVELSTYRISKGY